MASDRKRLNYVLRCGVWVVVPSPFFINGRKDMGTMTYMVKTRKGLDAAMRAERRGRGRGRD